MLYYLLTFLILRTSLMYRAKVRRLVLVMEGLGLLCFDLSSADTEFWWLEDEQ